LEFGIWDFSPAERPRGVAPACGRHGGVPASADLALPASL